MDKSGSKSLAGTTTGESRFGPTSRSLPIALLRARETVMVPIRDMLQASGITEQQWRILRVVDERGEIEHSAIAEAACLQLPSLTRILKSMETAGLVARRSDQADKRRSLVRVTEAGKALLDNHRPQNAKIFARLEAQFGKEKLEALLDLLDDLQHLRL